MLRRLFTLASALSLLVCALMVAQWVRSYYVSDQLAYVTADAAARRCDEYRLNVTRGLVRFQHAARHFETPEAVDLVLNTLREFDDEPLGASHSTHSPVSYERTDSSFLTQLGFVWKSGVEGPRHLTRVRPIRKPLGQMTLRWYYCYVPLWLIIFLFAIPCFPLLMRLRRRWALRQRPGLCSGCRYDLTGNTSGVCPECGMPVPQKAGL